MSELFDETSRQRSDDSESAKPEAKPAPPSRKKLIIAGAVALAVVLSIAGGIWYYVTPSSADSPEEAVELYIQALDSGDEDQFKEVICAQDRESMNADQEAGDSSMIGAGIDFSDVSYRVRGAEKVESDVYRVNYTIKAKIEYDGQSQRIDTDGTYVVVKEEGDWRVCESRRL
ncbi:MAG: DUF4878 domain-containing protein [Corynebacteriales bacterium]|nr:DUF4878 domain-containing protein [Mycobacteriales bacterium]